MSNQNQQIQAQTSLQTNPPSDQPVKKRRRHKKKSQKRDPYSSAKRLVINKRKQYNRYNHKHDLALTARDNAVEALVKTSYKLGKIEHRKIIMLNKITSAKNSQKLKEVTATRIKLSSKREKHLRQTIEKQIKHLNHLSEKCHETGNQVKHAKKELERVAIQLANGDFSAKSKVVEKVEETMKHLIV